MNKNFLLLLVVFVAISFNAFAQEEKSNPVQLLDERTSALEDYVSNSKKLKISGYIQAQYQWGQSEEDGTYFKLTRANSFEASPLNGAGEYKGKDNFSRFGIRRGRVKFTYTQGIAEGVLQLDMTDGGIGFKDVYIGIKDPWINSCGVKVGIMDRPFGHEISYSSSRRESPERSRIFQRLFPGERDMGAMLILQAPKTSPWSIIKFEGGLFSGNGSSTTAAFRQFDSHFDFIGRLGASKTFGSDMTLSGGVSLYAGKVMLGDSLIYVMKDNKFVLDSRDPKNIGGYAKRQYMGVDLQYSVMTVAGLTQLRGEYIWGEHAQNEGGTYNYNTVTYPPLGNNSTTTYTTIPKLDDDGNIIGYTTTSSTTTTNNSAYMRKINGGYVILTQDLGTLPFTVVAKYDWFNPNTEVSGNNIALPNKDKEGNLINGFTKDDKQAKATGNYGEIAKSNIGLGLIWRINNSLRLTAYYDIASNETTENLKNTKLKDKDGNETDQITSYGYEGKRPADVFTLRLQYKF